MTVQGFALFDTAIGPCGIAWGAKGILGVQLPEGSPSMTRARMARRFPDASETTPPAHVRDAIDGIVGLFDGRPSDLSAIELNMDGVPAFCRRVYEVARTIPPGSTLTYGEIASRLGEHGAARAVGQALGNNPFAIVVPCHRVLAANGKTGGFSASGGVSTKLRMLSIERTQVPDELTLFDTVPEPDSTGSPLGFDPATAVAQLRSADRDLGRLIDVVGPFGLRLRGAPTMFFALAEAVIYQQLSTKAAETIFGRMCALFPGNGPAADRVPQLSDEQLRGAGLSRAKLLSLRDLARRVTDGEIPDFAEARGMPDDTLIERLVTVRGIGRWTAEMVLIFQLGRPDVLPIDDHGIRLGFASALRLPGLPTRQELAERGARWQPYRTVASWYLWEAADLARERGR